MIKNIIFDMGNVCCIWDSERISKRLSDDIHQQRLINEGLFQSKQWVLLDQGLITVEQALKEIVTLYPDNRTLFTHAIYHWYDYFDEIESMKTIIETYKEKGYKIYLLSNCSMQFYDYYQTKSIFSLFDDFYISAKSHLLKPDITIYQDFCKKMKVDPEECIFIDDVKDNVLGSQKALMHGIVFDGDVFKLETNINKTIDDCKE